MSDFKISRTYTDNNTEEEVHRKISKDMFMDHFYAEKIKITDINGNNSDPEILKKLNVFLKRIKTIFTIDISEMLTYLDEEGFKVERIYPVLSYENTIQVKQEISKKFWYKESIKDRSNQEFYEDDNPE